MIAPERPRPLAVTDDPAEVVRAVRRSRAAARRSGAAIGGRRSPGSAPGSSSMNAAIRVGQRGVVDLQHVLGVLLARAREVERADEHHVVGHRDLRVHVVVDASGAYGVEGLPGKSAALEHLRQERALPGRAAVRRPLVEDLRRSAWRRRRPSRSTRPSAAHLGERRRAPAPRSAPARRSAPAGAARADRRRRSGATAPRPWPGREPGAHRRPPPTATGRGSTRPCPRRRRGPRAPRSRARRRPRAPATRRRRSRSPRASTSPASSSSSRSTPPSPSRTTYLWCIRSGIARDALSGTPSASSSSGLGARRRREPARAAVVRVVGDAHRHATAAAAPQRARHQVARARRAGARRRAPGRASARAAEPGRRARSAIVLGRLAAVGERAAAGQRRGAHSAASAAGRSSASSKSRPSVWTLRWRTTPSSSTTNDGAAGADDRRADAVGLRDRLVDVGQQRHRQPVVGRERRVRVEVLAGDPDDDRVEAVHVVGAVAVGAELLRADRRVVAGVEEQHDAPPAVLGQAEGALGALERRSPARGRRPRSRHGWQLYGTVDPGSPSTPRASPRAPRASSRRSSASRRRRATSAARRRRPRSRPRWRPTPPASSASRAPRPTTRPTCSLRAGAAPARPRILLLGHLDTVVAHDAHQPLRRDGDRLIGSGAIDMKGGDVLALGVLRALAAAPATSREAALLLVCDEEWRIGPFAHVDALRGLRRVPVLRGRRSSTRARATTRSSCSARRRAPSRCARRAARRTRARRPTRASTRCSRSRRRPRPSPRCHAPARRRPPHRRADGPARRRRVQRRPRRGRAHLRRARRPQRGLRPRARRRSRPSVGGGDARGASSSASGPGWTAARRPRRCSARPRRSWGARSPPARRGGASDASHFAASIPLTVDGLGPARRRRPRRPRARPGALGAPARGGRAGPRGGAPGALRRHRADAGREGFPSRLPTPGRAGASATCTQVPISPRATCRQHALRSRGRCDQPSPGRPQRSGSGGPSDHFGGRGRVAGLNPA